MKGKLLQTNILTDLECMWRKKKCFSFKVMKANKNAIPDIFFTTPNTGGVFVEVKGDNDRLSDKQSYVIGELNKYGSKAITCYSWGEWLEIKSNLQL